MENSAIAHHETPLHKAVKLGNTQTVLDLIANGAKIDSRNKHNKTPLHIAARGNHLTIVDILLQNGADIDAQSLFGRTPLHNSVCRGNLEHTPSGE